MAKFNISCSKSRILAWVEWWETDINTANNTSVVHAKVYIQRQDNGYTTYGTADTSITIGSSTQSGSTQFSNTGASASLLLEKSATVYHDADGKKTVTISVSVGGTLCPFTASGSGQATLTAIARASKVSLSTDAVDMGDGIYIYIHTESSSFKHRVTWVLNGTERLIESSTQSEKILWDTGTVFPYCKSKSCTVTVKVETYSGSTAIGSNTASFTATVPASSKPTFTSVAYTQTSTAVSSLLGNTSGVVQNKSTVKVTFTGAQAKNSAAIKYYCVRYNGLTYLSSSSNSVWVYNITKNAALDCFVMDDRDMQSDTQVLTFSAFYAYDAPVISSVSLKRTDGVGTAVTLLCIVDIAPVIASKGTATLYYSYAEAGGSYGSEISLGKLTAAKTTVQRALSPIFSADKNYQVKLRVVDTFGSQSYETILQTAKPELSIRKGCVGINCIPTETGGPLQIGGKNVFDLIYPVGSIYLSVSSTSPQTLFGGTWQRIQNRFLLAAGSSYAAGATGGEATHTLTRAEMPSHRHRLQIANTSSSASNKKRVLPYIDATARWWNAGDGYDDSDMMETSGSGAAHNNMPPYLAVYIWKRTA